MTDEKIRGIVSRMTVREKVMELTQLRADFYPSPGAEKAASTGPWLQAELGEDERYSAGSILSNMGAEEIIALQTAYLKKNPHGIPLLMMTDIIHGFRTVFPIPLALGCAFDEKAAEEMARISALESAVSGLHVTFSPMVDLVRDPRWGRVMESTGEDPLLNSRYAAAMVRGYQGDDASAFGKVGCCVKHFAAYGAAEAGRDYNTVDMSEGVLREYYLPAYHAAVDAGCFLVMTSFNILNRIPASANRWLLRDLLRDEWGFDGVVISDHTAVSEVINHSVAEDGEGAARACFNAGVDIEMMSLNYRNNLPGLIESGEIPEDKLNIAVERVLQLKNRLGLFEKPCKDADAALEKQYVLCADHRRAARRIAAQSVVLLKNDDQLLPLKREAALIGPFAAAQGVNGGWTVYGKNEDCVSLYDGLRAKGLVSAPPPAWEESAAALEANLAFCKNSDTVIAALGESADDTGEAKSKARLTLSAYQEELLRRLRAAGKKVIAVIFSGRPLVLEEAAANSGALVMGWFLGVESGNALADILAGDALPSGRLAMSFPRAEGQIPVYYNHFNTGRPSRSGWGRDDPYSSAYLDIPNKPLYPFGYGLSYGECHYSPVRLSAQVITSGSITAAVTVKNTGAYPAAELVQLYIRDCVGQVVRPVRELKDYTRITLAPGEEREVYFTIDTEMLAFTDYHNRRIVEPGRFIVFIDGSSDTDNGAEFVLKP